MWRVADYHIIPVRWQTWIGIDTLACYKYTAQVSSLLPQLKFLALQKIVDRLDDGIERSPEPHHVLFFLSVSLLTPNTFISAY
jgi:hypothetical protein